LPKGYSAIQIAVGNTPLAADEGGQLTGPVEVPGAAEPAAQADALAPGAAI
jgi:hypothetical protein